MPVNVQTERREGLWVCHLQPQWDAFTLWLLVWHLFVLALLVWLATYLMAGHELTARHSVGNETADRLFTWLGLAAMVALRLGNMWWFARWMLRGETITVGNGQLGIVQPSIINTSVTLPAAEAKFSLEASTRGLAVVRPDGAIRRGRISVWVGLSWHTLGRGLTDEQAEELLHTLRSETHLSLRRPTERPQSASNPEG
jgi:hypothetical protein